MSVKYKTLIKFVVTDPSDEYSGDDGDEANGVFIDSDGNLIVATVYGGPYDNFIYSGYGNVVELPKVGEGYGKLKTLVNFVPSGVAGTIGTNPLGNVVADANGNLFGVLQYDPLYDSNEIYEIQKTSTGYGAVTAIATPTGLEGNNLSGNLTIDSAGNLFGTAGSGGFYNYGTVFEVAKTSTGYVTKPTVLVTFNLQNGAGPTGGVTIDPAGNLIGIDDLGVFEIAKTDTGYSSTPMTLTSDIKSDLVIDATGNFFGVGAAGAFGYGTIVEVDKTAGGYGAPVTLATFDYANGVNPYDLIIDGAGDLFGMTQKGGANLGGTLFEIPKTAIGYGHLKTIYSFSDINDENLRNGLVGDAAGDLFGAMPSGAFEITGAGYVACYGRDTLITTTTGEVPVQDLAIGDHVVTASGIDRPIKWIGRRAYAGRFANANPDVLPICFKAGSLAENTPRRDLWVSPKHAMFLDQVLIPAECLVNGVSIIQADRIDRVEYFHIELDSHDVIIAEGALSETFVDDRSRAMFHNASDFAALYPGTEPVEAVYCAPRVEDGFVLEAVRSRLADRAGLQATGLTDPGPFRGTLDRADIDGIEGWAQNIDHPEGAVCLDVFVDGRLRQRTMAGLYRDDLRAVGIGSGAHSFRLSWDEPLSLGEDHIVEVRRSLDGATLWCSPRHLIAARRAA